MLDAEKLILSTYSAWHPGRRRTISSAAGFDTERLQIVRYALGRQILERRMVMKFEELVLVAALVVGLITTGWAVLAMAALQ
jgi:hypothetical protein